LFTSFFIVVAPNSFQFAKKFYRAAADLRLAIYQALVYFRGLLRTKTLFQMIRKSAYFIYLCTSLISYTWVQKLTNESRLNSSKHWGKPYKRWVTALRFPRLWLMS